MSGLETELWLWQLKLRKERMVSGLETELWLWQLKLGKERIGVWARD